MINELSKQIHENNKAKGFYEDEKNIGEMLALIHSEVSEALEADRKGRTVSHKFQRSWSEKLSDKAFKEMFEANVKDSFEDELADIMIRVMDLSAFKGVDIEGHIMAKLRFNAMRPYKHGKKY